MVNPPFWEPVESGAAASAARTAIVRAPPLPPWVSLRCFPLALIQRGLSV
jgi:hypothetical protein